MRVGRSVLCVVGALLASLLTWVPAPATEPEAVPAPAPSGSDDTRLLRDDMVRHQLSPRARLVRAPTWPRGRITYHETIPAKWQWGLDRAIEAWNQAGGQVRFVKAPARTAKVRISYGDTYGADGLGGWTAVGSRILRGFVHLSPAYKRVDEKDDEQRVWVGILFAHELGHVLGFGHTSQACSLMAPVFYFGECGPLSEGKPGYYRCRWLDAPLLRSFTRRYGGNPRRPPAHCPVHPLPPQLRDVSFGGGAGANEPVRVAWTPPRRAAAGTKVRVAAWGGDSCGREPGSARVVQLPPGSGSWTDPRPGQGPACYQVGVVNRSGAGPRPFQRVLERYAPIPEVPTATARWEDESGSFLVRWQPPAGHRLVGQVDYDDPATCVTTYRSSLAEELYEEEPGVFRVYAYGAETCLVLFADNGVHRSAGQVLRLELPAPTATPVVGPVAYDAEQGGWVVEATLDSADRLGIEVVPGACPDAPPDDAQFWDHSELGGGRYYLWWETEGVNCALVAAVNEHGRHGPVVARPFTVAWD